MTRLSLIVLGLYFAGCGSTEAPQEAPPEPTTADPAPADPAPQPAEPAPDSVELETRGPIVCTDEDITAENVRIEGTDPAVVVQGNCTITITRCELSSARNTLLLDVGSFGSVHLSGCEISAGADDNAAEHAAIEIRGQGAVHLADSTVTGDPSVAIDSAGDLHAVNATFNGPKIQRGTGDIHGSEGVVWNE